MQARSCALLVCIAALGACGVFGDDAALVELRALATPTARLGDSVVVRVTIENRSDVTVTYQGNLCPRFFKVYDAVGEYAGPPISNVICQAIDIPRELVADEKHEYVGYWNARTNGPRLEPIVVTAGRYRVEPDIGVRHTAGGRAVRVRSITSAITVVE